MPSGSSKGHGRKCHPRKEVTCKICIESFMPTQSQQRHCRKCIPDGKAYHHWKTYGLTVEQFDAMLLDQENTCPGCNRDFASLTNVKNDVPHVDHCHLTNEIRGLLCRSCNHVLGLAEDSSETLHNLAAYIEAFKSRPKETSYLNVVRSAVRKT